MTRRLRRELGLAVPWGVHTFLSMAKEKCAKESQRHGDSRGGPPRFASRASSCGSPSGCPRPRFASLTRQEKGFYCPFWRRGSLCRAQHDWPAFTCDPARSELAYVRHQNGRAFFPPLPIAALAPAVGCIHTQILQAGMLRCSLDIPATQKASVGSNPRWPCLRAMRPVAEWRSLLCSWRESAPDPRAARPSAERR